jgi:RimJ/RimL family protein N-acetyltransferase
MRLIAANGIHLTEFRRSDQDALVEYLNDRDIYIRTLRIPYPYTAADAQNWFESIEEAAKLMGQNVQWAIRDNTENLIGGIGLAGFQGDHPHRVTLGYWLAKPFWGQGIMTSVVKTVCRHAFENLGLVKIAAHVFSPNETSARVLEKCGFTQEGFCPKHLVKDGKFIDVRLFGLLHVPASQEVSPDSLLIRSYQDRDKAQVVQLWNAVFPNNLPHNDPAADIRRKLAVQRDLFLVGELADEIVATVMAGFDGHRGWLHRVAVSPHDRRRGFGRAMLAETEKRLVEIGCTKINLQVNATNQTVVEFYLSFGYKTEDRISMGKRIG